MESRWAVRVESEVLHSAKKERIILLTEETGRLTGMVTSCVKIAF
jgi:hypothetical protein